jgi:hypothetical protein
VRRTSAARVVLVVLVASGCGRVNFGPRSSPDAAATQQDAEVVPDAARLDPIADGGSPRMIDATASADATATTDAWTVAPDAVASLADASEPDASSLCAVPLGFMDDCDPFATPTGCTGLVCWQGRLTGAGSCARRGCSPSCTTDAECVCIAIAVGEADVSMVQCSSEGVCDFTGTGLGTLYLCS